MSPKVGHNWVTKCRGELILFLSRGLSLQSNQVLHWALSLQATTHPLAGEDFIPQSPVKLFKLAYTKPAYLALPFLHFDSETTIKGPSWSSSPPPHLLPPTPHPQPLSHDKSLCVPSEVLPGTVFQSCKHLSTFSPVNSVWLYHTSSKIIWLKKLSTHFDKK